MSTAAELVTMAREEGRAESAWDIDRERVAEIMRLRAALESIAGIRWWSHEDGFHHALRTAEAALSD